MSNNSIKCRRRDSKPTSASHVCTTSGSDVQTKTQTDCGDLTDEMLAVIE